MRAVSRVLVFCAALPSIGCIESMLINGQIEGTRRASSAFDTIGDYELAGRAVASALVQFEGMHQLAPENADALFLLAKGWTGYGYGFAEDDMERAEDEGDREATEYHRARAVRAYDRAIAYGLDLMGQNAQGFDAARKDDAALRAWLAESFSTAADGANLFWVAYAWLARGNLMKDHAETVAELYVGVAILERSVALDPTYNNHAGTVVLASYHARSAMAELEDAKKLFDQALEKTSGTVLLVQLNYATKYACAKADAALYDKLLKEVLANEAPDPELRLMNSIARRRAKRWLDAKRMFDACSMEPAAEPTAAGQS